MATSSVSSVLSLLTQPGSALSSVAANLPASVLQHASAQDLAKISNAAIQLQQAENLFGSTVSANGVGAGNSQTPAEIATAPDVNALLLHAENPLTLDVTGGPPAPAINLYG